MGVGDTGPDDDLLRELARGSEAAFETLVERWRPRLYAFLVRLSGRLDVAEDLLAETLLRLVDHAREGGPRRHAGAWLFRVARNLYVDWLRSRRLDEARTAELTADCAVAAAHGSPFAALAADETARALERAIAALPRDQREVLLLVGIEGLAPRDAAEVCGISPEAARKRLQRARASVAADLAAAGLEVER